jgi:RNA polymerase sigma-70 factor (ECF subfamily)
MTGEGPAGDGAAGEHGGADQERLAAAFSQARARLIRVAYAILGTRAEAEDVVADCWLRLVTADERGPVRDVESWAVVAVSRMALDVLRSARVRRERYVGPWLPEPVLSGFSEAGAAVDPADQVTLDDEVSYALLVVLEALTPPERTAFVLHDLFGLAFGEIATVVGRSPGSVRQLASRARRHVREHAPSPSADAAAHRRVVEAFAAAAGTGDLAALIRLLDPDVVLVSDGGGVVSAARKPVTGAEHVARFILGIIAKARAEGRVERVGVNGALGFATYDHDKLVGIMSVTVAGERVIRLDSVRAPGKLPRG